MAISFEPTDEQRKNQHDRIKQIFNLTDEHTVLRNWSMESVGKEAMLTIQMVEFVDLATVNALINGLPVEPANPEQETGQ
jgi:hypothetical protein